MKNNDIQVIAFTASFDRWIFAQNAIRGMMGQTFQRMIHVVNFIETNPKLVEVTRQEFQGEINAGRLLLMETDKNTEIFDNAMKTIERGFQVQPKAKLVIKIDDDDWYSRNYVHNLWAVFEKEKFDFSSQRGCSVVVRNQDGVEEEISKHNFPFGPTISISTRLYKVINGFWKTQYDKLSRIKKNKDRCYDDTIFREIASKCSWCVWSKRPRSHDVVYYRHRAQVCICRWGRFPNFRKPQS